MTGFEGNRGDPGVKGFIGSKGGPGLIGQGGPKGVSGYKGAKGETVLFSVGLLCAVCLPHKLYTTKLTNHSHNLFAAR